MDGDCAVEQLLLNNEWCADDEQRGKGRTGFDNLAERGNTRLEQCVLVKQILVGIPRQAELREGRDRCAFAARALGELDRAFCIFEWIAEPNGRDTDREAHEPVAIHRPERCSVHNRSMSILAAELLLALARM